MVLKGIIRHIHWPKSSADSITITQNETLTSGSNNGNQSKFAKRKVKHPDVDASVQLLGIRSLSTPDRFLDLTNSEDTSFESEKQLKSTITDKSSQILSSSTPRQHKRNQYENSIENELCDSSPLVHSSQSNFDFQHFAEGLRAAREGDSSRILDCINVWGIPVDAQTVHGITMLHCAIRDDKLECVKLLIRYGADMQKVTGRGRSPVHIAARNGAVRSLKLLLNKLCSKEKHSEKLDESYSKKYSFLLERDENGDTPLHLSCRTYKRDCLKALLRCIILNLGWTKAEELLQWRNEKGETPVHIACLWRSLQTVRLLLTSELTKAIAKVCPYAETKKIAKALRNASVNTLTWNLQTGTLLHDLAASRCSCSRSEDSYEGQRRTYCNIDILSLPGNLQYGDDDVDIPEHRCRTCDQAVNAIVVLLASVCPTLLKLRDVAGRTPLMHATAQDAVGVVNALLATKVDVEEIDPFYKTALHHAAVRGISRQVAVLISCGASPSRQDDKGATPLHYAAVRSFTSCLRFLYSANKFIDIRNSYGHTAFMWGTMCGAESSLLTMLDANPLLSRREADVRGFTALHLAAERNQAEAIKLLVRFGWDLETKNEGGETPFLVAASNGCISAVHALLDCGANVLALDKEGNSALHLSSQSDTYRETLCELLLWLSELSVINHRNTDGKTALFFAAEGAAAFCFRELLKNGADIYIRDVRGWDPLMAAIQMGSWPVLTIALKNSPNINCYSPVDGCSTLSLALERRNNVLANFLKKNGAKLPRQILDTAARKIQRWYRARIFLRCLAARPSKKGRNIRMKCAVLGANMFENSPRAGRVLTVNRSLVI